MIREILSQNETGVTVSDHDKITSSDDNKPIEKNSSVNAKRSQGKKVRFSKHIHVRLIDEDETIIDYTYPASKIKVPAKTPIVSAKRNFPGLNYKQTHKAQCGYTASRNSTKFMWGTNGICPIADPAVLSETTNRGTDKSFAEKLFHAAFGKQIPVDMRRRLEDNNQLNYAGDVYKRQLFN